MNNTTTMTVPGNPYFHASPAPPPSSSSDTFNNLGRKLETATKKAETFAGNLYHHLRTGPGLVDVAMTRIEQAGRVIADGGFHNVFQREFGGVNGEKLKKTYACYLSTTTGPVMGTLYISNKRIGFRSDSQVLSGPVGGPGQWVYYKVMVMLDQVLAVNPSSNPNKPAEKYIEILTKDGHEFWFMGFISYDQALKNLYKALQHCN
uniref:GRAM domain-containing protein n=2 Tax=Chenopodium quinoa TaxID=63459 RepID=A0A803N9P3_CHEQI